MKEEAKGLKWEDLFKGRIGIGMLILAALSAVLLLLNFTGIVNVGYTIALAPLGLDVLNIIIFTIAMIF